MSNKEKKKGRRREEKIFREKKTPSTLTLIGLSCFSHTELKLRVGVPLKVLFQWTPSYPHAMPNYMH